MTPSLQPPAPRTRHAWAVALVAVLLLAAGLRLVPISRVFSAGGVAYLADGDPYYHVLRARDLAVRGTLSWRDPSLNYPHGAVVPWPPLFDAILAAPAWILHGGHPTDADVERTAAWVPVALGVLCVLLGALLARELLGERGGAIAALLLAALPIQVQVGIVGRPDQHVLEAALAIAMAWVLARSAARPRGPLWPGAVALGLLLSAAFWTWLGSAFHVALVCAYAGAAHVFARASEEGAGAPVRLVGRAMAAGAVAMGLSVAWLGPPGALGRIELGGISAFPVVLLAGASVWCALLEWAARRTPAAGLNRRALEVLAASAIVATALLAIPGFRQTIARGLLAAGRGNSWYASIAEFRPILLAPYASVPDQLRDAAARFGLVPLLALVGLRRPWAERAAPERRAALVLLSVLAVTLTALAAYMTRFAYYAAPPLAMFGAMGFEEVRRAGARMGGARAGWLAAGAALLIALSPTASALAPDALHVARFDTIAAVLAPMRAGAITGDGAILARWDAGHHVRYLSGKPIIASPFGTEGGERAMEDTAAFFLSDAPDTAASLLRSRRVRWVLLEDPANAVLEALSFWPRTPPPVTLLGDRFAGRRIHCEPSYDDLVAVRLYYDAGSATPRSPQAVGTFRVVDDVGAQGRPPAARLVELVEGAVLDVSGAAPGAEVFAQTAVTTPAVRFAWTARAVADGAGRARLRVAYATGLNGLTGASPYRVWATASSASLVTIVERDVQDGALVQVALGRSR